MTILKGMTWDHPRGYDPLIATTAQFRSRHPGVDIVWEKRSLQDFEQYPVDELAARYDLIIIDHPHIGEVARPDILVPFDALSDQAPLARLAAESVGESFESYRWDGRIWALPVDAATQVQAYRPDRTGPARRWDEVMAHARAGEVLLPLRSPHALMCFYSIAANLGSPCARLTTHLLERHAAKEVLAVLREIADLVPATCFAMDPIQASEALVEDEKAALIPLLYGYVSYARPGFRRRALRFADIPVLGNDGPKGTTLGGTGLAVSARCRDVAAAKAFAFYAASAEIQRGIYAASGGQPGNRVAWLDAKVNADAGDFYRDTLLTHDTAWVRPRHAGYIPFQEKASHLIADCLKGETPVARTIDLLDEAYRGSLAGEAATAAV